MHLWVRKLYCSDIIETWNIAAVMVRILCLRAEAAGYKKGMVIINEKQFEKCKRSYPKADVYTKWRTEALWDACADSKFCGRFT